MKISSSGSRVASLGRTERRIDMTKLIVVFRNFANAPKDRDCNSHNGRNVALKYSTAVPGKFTHQLNGCVESELQKPSVK